MQPDQIAQAARERLDPALIVATHFNGLTAAVRALLSTNPETDRVRAVFD